MPKQDQNNQEMKTVPQMEDEVIEFWKKNYIFEKSVEKNPKDNMYVFYDGPPFISGLPHYGHLLGSIAKDLIPRYWTMKGKRVERVWGWDAHGLTVENKVQKKFGIKDRRAIEEFGLEKFTEECYKYTSEVSAEWEWYVDKIGRWVDMKHAYKTIDQSYMESVMWAFKQLYDKGKIYEGVRTSLYCTTCGTPVSNFEIAMDNSYKDVEDPSVTIKFPVISEGDFKGVNILAWTTTPWTLPSNRALVVDENETYVLVQSSGEKFVLARPRLDFVFKNITYSIEKEFPGKVLLGLEYEPPFRIYKSKEGEYKVYSFEGMVTMDDGTGIVHSAPGFGEIDTEMGRHYGLTVMMTIDDEGKFLPGTENTNPWEGVYYSKANESISENLTERKILFKNEKIVHRFPFHDRCDTLLIQRAQKSWFIAIASIKSDMLKTNEAINWVPEHLKSGRFAQGIEQAPDWCISRSRFWATPMPVWQAADGEKIVIESVKELEELSDQKVKDLHRPYIDKIEIKRNGKTFKRVPDVLDSWMESGSMPYAQFHYPFENREKFDQNFPGDYIVEYIAQVRAWFYVMHVLSTMLFDSNAFKNVISTGVMAGSDGRKMSKTYGNYTDPKDVLQNYGGDALRLYLMGSPLMVGENANFDEPELRTKLRNVLNPLWNSLKYFLIYANQYEWNDSKFVESNNILDKWIVARLNQLIQVISTSIESYNVPPSVKAVEEFVDDLSRWYVRRSRERISNGNEEALSTLYHVLHQFVLSAAPIIPFMTEGIYLELKRFSTKEMPESVHLCKYPSFDEKLIASSKNLLENMSKTRELSSLVLALRTEKGIGVRQPLSTLATILYLPEEFGEIVKDEVNVKTIDVVENIDQRPAFVADEKGIVALDFTITESLRLEGLARDFIREIQDLRKKQGLTVADNIRVIYENSDQNKHIIDKFAEDIKKKVLAQELVPGIKTAVERL